jgi:hypothetical protein
VVRHVLVEILLHPPQRRRALARRTLDRTCRPGHIGTRTEPHVGPSTQPTSAQNRTGGETDACSGRRVPSRAAPLEGTLEYPQYPLSTRWKSTTRRRPAPHLRIRGGARRRSRSRSARR